MRPSFRSSQQVRAILEWLDKIESFAKPGGINNVILSNKEFEILYNAMLNPQEENKKGFQYENIFVKPKGKIK